MNENTKNILIVEDEKPLCEAARLKVEKMGFRARCVSLAEEALEILKNNGIDLIWLDLRLPKMDGLQFLELIRSNPVWKDKKVIIVSVSGGPEAKEKAKSLGAVDYIVKSELKLDDIVKRAIAAI